MLRKANPDMEETAIPVELVTCSGSGLDQHISPAAAKYQVTRIAKANNMSEEKVGAIIEKCTDSRFLGVFGEKNRKCSESQFDVGRYPVTSTLKRFQTSAHLYTILISKQTYLCPFNTNKDRIKEI